MYLDNAASRYACKVKGLTDPQSNGGFVLKSKYLFVAVLFLTAIGIFVVGCKSSSSSVPNDASPKATLDTFFSSAVRQDYATTYSCYYKLYQDRIPKDEFIKHRKEASILQSYKITSLKQSGDSAHAEALLTYAASKKLKRDKPKSVNVKEDLIKENGHWKIKVW